MRTGEQLESWEIDSDDESVICVETFGTLACVEESMLLKVWSELNKMQLATSCPVLVWPLEGFYLVVNMSGDQAPKLATISVPVLSPAPEVCVGFWFYMLGSSVSRLDLQVQTVCTWWDCRLSMQTRMGSFQQRSGIFPSVGWKPIRGRAYAQQAKMITSLGRDLELNLWSVWRHIKAHKCFSSVV